ncbi:MAG: hypothetical protein GY757_24500, partial [bacterium]|nr:hypothetical protein [bacterium]
MTFVEVVKVVLRNRRGASSSTNKHAGITAVQEAPGDVSSLNKKSESNHAVPVPARGDDHFFLRRRILRLMAPEIAKSRDLEDILFQASKDPSPYVRRELARILPEASEDAFSYWSQHLVTRDPSPRVRASVLLALQTPLEQNRLRGKIREILEIVFAGETDSFVLRVAIKVSLHCIAFLSAQTPQAARDWSFWLLPVLNRLHTEAVDPVIRRRAASAREHLWCMGDSEALQLKKRLEEKATGTGPGKRLFLPADFFKNTSEKTVGRVLSLMAQQDYGFELRKETFWYELIRGPLFRHRWWRFLYEIRRPSPAKRQGFSHTRSRSFEGHLRAPSDILAELTPTEVPGEPVYTPSEQGWRPYLPLPEDYLSSLFLHIRTKPVKIFTSEGITTIRPPQSPFKRVSAFFKLSARFHDYAGIRIRETSTRDEPEAFTKELAALGFQTHYQPYAEESGVDPSVSRYFPALGAVPVSELLEKFKDYFVFIYENTFTELILFAGSSLLIFVGRNLYLNARHRRLRKRIPLVIGGWGTRGKSSVERLKAGLINAMGYSLVSKTTGSEATFLHADTFRPLREIPLFRPYDKPTIWEQQYVTRIAGGVDAEVLLWECMGLQPDYVETLQQSWMRDDFSTITNTYPDHEDIMGPAGIDV